MAKKNNQNKKKPPSAHDLFSMLWSQLTCRASQQRKPMYAYKPSYTDYLGADADYLSTLRQGVL